MQTPVDEILTNGRTRRERTRGKGVDRLGQAVEALVDLATRDDSWRSDARQAKVHWMRSVELRWELALSAKHVAEAEARKQSSATISTADLEQEAVIGLLEAARRYEPAKQTRFPTYAKWWVKAAMSKSLRRDRTIRLPKSATKDMNKLRARLEHAENNSERISVEQAAKEVNVRPQRARQLLTFQQPISLDAPAHSEEAGGTTLVSNVADKQAERPDEGAALAEERERLERAMTFCLDERARDIVSRRYGLDSPKETLAAIGEDHGITAQRVRQIQKRAVRDLTRWFQAH